MSTIETDTGHISQLQSTDITTTYLSSVSSTTTSDIYLLGNTTIHIDDYTITGEKLATLLKLLEHQHPELDI
jgi:hypothetical protein